MNGGGIVRRTHVTCCKFFACFVKNSIRHDRNVPHHTFNMVITERILVL